MDYAGVTSVMKRSLEGGGRGEVEVAKAARAQRMLRLGLKGGGRSQEPKNARKETLEAAKCKEMDSALSTSLGSSPAGWP